MPALPVAVHVGQLHQPVPGGIGRYVRRLLAALPAAGVAPTPFAAGPRPAGPPFDDPSFHYCDLGWPRGGVRYELWHRLRRPAVRARGEVVHAPSLAVAPPGRRPLVVTVHDLVFLRQPEHLTARGVAFHRRGLEIARKEAAVVVVPTAFGRDDLVREGFERERIIVAPHGVDTHRPVRSAEEGGECEGDDDGALESLGVRRPFVLAVGTIEPRKGVNDLVAAHAVLRHAHPGLGLVLAGPKGWGPVPDLDRPGVVLTGSLDDRALDLLYRSAIALVSAERYAGFGMPILEAMARGCPVVTTDAACLPEVAGEAALIVPVGDVAALVGAVDSIATDDRLRRRLVAAGHDRAAQFTWEASARAHAGAYRQALGAAG